jgi:hypothetical protein
MADDALIQRIEAKLDWLYEWYLRLEKRVGKGPVYWRTVSEINGDHTSQWAQLHEDGVSATW